ncbi:MAG: DNA-protecting protein DprA [Spirochaetia bacterium]|nr:MAG: DNA-protecting protein DprA [Spirochaetia bacterium]
MNALKINRVSLGEADYPALLKEIPNPPKEIFYLGDLLGKSLVEPPKIAIIGTRKATAYGRAVAKEMAQEFAKKGIVVVSGLAMGIDTAAHEGALLGGGKTIAVLACGLDLIYPRQNENLAKMIIETGGAIISEYPAGTLAMKHQFLERNRIVSGLGVAAVVVEAPKESGALVTARLAAEQGREVFVAPGPMNHSNYFGSHKLVRDGARLISAIEDVFEDLGFDFETEKRKIPGDLNGKEKIIFETIEQAGLPVGIDKIIEITKLEPQKVNQVIALLVIRDILKEAGQGYAIK